MNCFVIMPFTPEFDDVYLSIKGGVLSAAANNCRCFRLDETRPAGRITDRLMQELRTASLCVADLTGNRPNVMWEVGFAMALSCPTIIVTQSMDDLPFDIRDMQSLQYDRNRLATTLTQPLQQMVVDTLSSLRTPLVAKDAQQELVGQLLSQMSELKAMVAQAVHSWTPPAISDAAATSSHDVDLTRLEGAWFDEESGSHMYAKVIGGDLIVPYAFTNDESLTGAYFGWRKAGNYWFARYAWLHAAHSGFSFLRQTSVDVVKGAWWSDEEGLGSPSMPPETFGVPSEWRRQPKALFPTWATQFFEDVHRKGLPGRLTSR